MKLALSLVLSGATVVSFAAGPTVYRTAAQLPGLRLYDSGPVSYAPAAAGSIRRGFSVRFKNETAEELASIDIRLRVDQDGRTIYRSQPVSVTIFDNVSVPHTGSLLPLNKTQWSAAVPFEYPSRFWNTRSTDHIEIVGGRVYTKQQDLHDPGHLYTWFCGHGAPDAIALFKKQPELLKVRNSRGCTAFMMAFSAGEPATIQYMAGHGCKWTDKSSGGTTVLHMAALKDAANLQFALQHSKGVDVPTTKGRTPLMKAIEYGNTVTVPWLLAHRASPNKLDSDGHPPAYYAISYGQKEMLAQLVKAGANRRYHDAKGYGWLHYAALENYYFMDAIHGYGVPVDDRVGKKPTPLMVAAQSGMQEPILWLLRHGANPLLKDAQGRDCYQLSKLSNTLHTDRFFRALMAQAGRS